jgi:hypothetical protein
VEDVNIFDCDTVTDKVGINLNMLYVLMLNAVGGEVDHADVVALDEGSSRQGVV